MFIVSAKFDPKKIARWAAALGVVLIAAIVLVVVVLLVVLWLRSPMRRNRRYGKAIHGAANRRYRGRRR